jgi:histidinol phosphatase-like PHP family hydrolase
MHKIYSLLTLKRLHKGGCRVGVQESPIQESGAPDYLILRTGKIVFVECITRPITRWKTIRERMKESKLLKRRMNSTEILIGIETAIVLSYQ